MKRSLYNDYEKFIVDYKLDMPFYIFIEKQNKPRIVLPKWLGLIFMNKEIIINLFDQLKNNEITDPNLDTKLINSVLKELDKLSK